MGTILDDDSKCVAEWRIKSMFMEGNVYIYRIMSKRISSTLLAFVNWSGNNYSIKPL